MNVHGYIKEEYVTDLGYEKFVNSFENITFKLEDLQIYIDKFIEIRSSGRIINTNFKDDEWILNAQKNESKSLIRFNTKLSTEMKLLLKCFTILGIIEGHVNAYTQLRIKYLNECLLQCFGYQAESEKNVIAFESWLLSKTKPLLSKLGPILNQFLNFYNPILKKELLEISNQICIFVDGVRTLPNFKDTLIFDHIITDFQKTWTDYEKLIFFPIILWWRVTLVIPMRVIEFCSLANDCITVDSSNRFLLKIPRKKVRAKKQNEINIADVLELNEDLFNLILEYKETTQDFNKTPYLLSYDAYCESLRVKKSNGRQLRKNNIDMFGTQQLSSLLVYFYEEIVEKKYNFTLEKIKLLDTRHYAFCNMMLQGFNMLTIARIGGHKTLNAQMHYFSHLENLSQSSIQFLAEQHNKFSSLPDQSSLRSEEKIIKAKSLLKRYTEDEIKNFFSMEFGYCTFNPEKCPVGDCRHCSHLYIPADQFNSQLIYWLNDESIRLTNLIKEQLELMKSITCNMTYNFGTFESDPIAQSELSFLAANSKKLREQKAQNDAKLNLIFREGALHDEE
ncbi:hypothetical protein ACYCS5_01530 [Paenibacillus sp. SEL3]